MTILKRDNEARGIKLYLAYLLQHSKDCHQHSWRTWISFAEPVCHTSENHLDKYHIEVDLAEGESRFILLVINIDYFIVAASADIGSAASLRSSHLRPTDEWADRCRPSSSYFHFLNYWPDEPFDSSSAVEGNLVAARNARARFKGSINFTKGSQK